MIQIQDVSFEYEKEQGTLFHPETAEVDACRIEHVISNESFERLKEAAFRNQENEISALSKAIKDKPTE